MVEQHVIDAAKLDGAYLREVLGVDRDGNHLRCPICQKTNLRCVRKEDSYIWGCFSGCGQGDIVDALVVFGKLSKGQAFQEIGKRFGSSTPRPSGAQKKVEQAPQPAAEERPERYATKGPDPVLDLEGAEDFIVTAHQHLMNRFHDINTTFKRGLSEECAVRRRLGFIENLPISWHPGKPWTIPAAWVLPITDENNALKGVKLHFEIRPTTNSGPWGSKSIWAPFGTSPAYKKNDDGTFTTSRHSYDGMWPHPATLRPKTAAQEFGLQTDWWVRKFQEHIADNPGDLKDQWDIAVETARLDHAYSKSINVEDFQNEDFDAAIQIAFHQMKAQIQRVVMGDIASNDRPQDRRQWDEYVFIFPGELKALAVESAGFMATSSTMGESRCPPPEMLQPLAGMRAAVCTDDDPPHRQPVTKKVTCVGRDWGRRVSGVCQRVGVVEVVTICGGKRLK